MIQQPASVHPGSTIRAWLRGLWMAILVLAATGCGDPTLPLPRDGVPDELAFSFGGFGITGTSVTLRGDTVVLRQTPWDGLSGGAVDSVRAVPTAEAWAAFWAAAEDAGVSRWRSRYAAEGVIDGAGWSLRLGAGGRVIESQGSNAYPDRRGREHEMDWTPEFRAFVSALGDLVGASL